MISASCFALAAQICQIVLEAGVGRWNSVRIEPRTSLRTVETVCPHVSIREQQFCLLVKILGLASSVGERLRGASAHFVLTLNFIIGMKNSVQGEKYTKVHHCQNKIFQIQSIAREGQEKVLVLCLLASWPDTLK